MEQIVRGATVVTLDPGRRVLPATDVSIRNGRIHALGGALKPVEGECEEIPAAGKLLLPGLVQAHVHLCQTLFRNAAEDLPLLPWLRERIWPLEAAHDETSMAASARLGLAELIRGGTTAALDMGSVHHTGAIFEAAREAGFRLTGGKAHMDRAPGAPAGLREDTEASLAEAAALCRRWNGAEEGLLHYAFAPRFVLSCSDELLAAAGDLAEKDVARLHTHASEAAEECAAVEARFGAPNIAVLARFGLLGAETVLAHGVHLAGREVDLLAETGTHLVHCPSANLKLASGVAPIPGLAARGIPLALGADGAACNNTLDAWTEMRLAALIHNPAGGPGALPAQTVLEMATLGGARALGLEEEIGSIEPGKQADLVLVGLDRPHLVPAGPDPAALLVFCAGRADVERVWIAGRPVLRDGRLATLDEEAVRAQGLEQAARIWKCAFS